MVIAGHLHLLGARPGSLATLSYITPLMETLRCDWDVEFLLLKIDIDWQSLLQMIRMIARCSYWSTAEWNITASDILIQASARPCPRAAGVRPGGDSQRRGQALQGLRKTSIPCSCQRGFGSKNSWIRTVDCVHDLRHVFYKYFTTTNTAAIDWWRLILIDNSPFTWKKYIYENCTKK